MRNGNKTIEKRKEKRGEGEEERWERKKGKPEVEICECVEEDKEGGEEEGGGVKEIKVN